MGDKVLPCAPIYDDVSSFFPNREERSAQALLGGFPCQADASSSTAECHTLFVPTWLAADVA
jgi:hypothetical protein